MTRTLRRLGALVVAGSLLLAAGCGGFGSGTTSDLATFKHYVALGDGFTAAPYTGDTASDDGCLRSSVNYPSLIAQSLDIKKFTDVSCVGAPSKAVDRRTSPPDRRKKVPAQIDAITESTDLVTLGIGIEDSNLLHDLFNVCMRLPCRGRVPGKQVLLAVNRVGDGLVRLLREVQAKAPRARIVVVGYPQLTPVGESCKRLPRMNEVELDAANMIQERLTSAMAAAAREVGAYYVDVNDLSQGHDACAVDPWVGGKQDKKGSAVAFHPTADEQQAVAHEIVRLVRVR